MRTFLVFLLGIVVGAALLGGALAWKAADLMVGETQSPVSVEETIARLKKAAEADGWKVLADRPLHKSVKEGAGIDIRPVHVVDLCKPDHAGKILSDDAARPIAVFMPCSIAVYEKADGKAYVAATNAALLGRAFGGVVAEVMSGPVAASQQKFVEAATAK